MKTNKTVPFYYLIRVGFLVNLLFFVVPVISSANDTVARVATGGITFLKSEDIAMLQETLEISTDKIKVHYRFMNESDQDIKTTVAFPMPIFGWDPESTQSNIPLRGFKTVVNGTVVETKIIRRAVVKGHDITNKLRKIGLSDKQIFETFACEDYIKNKCEYSKYQLSELEKLSAVKNGFPQWEVEETAVWEQEFPSGKELVIQHEYKPANGAYYGSAYMVLENKNKSADLSSNITSGSLSKKEVCLDAYASRAIENKMKTAVNKGLESVRIFLRDVEYVLGTGRNWKGPIKDFRLIIKKKSPDDIVSLCFPGKPQKIDATTIEFSQKDYVPQDKLIVYFYSVKGK